MAEKPQVNYRPRRQATRSLSGARTAVGAALLLLIMAAPAAAEGGGLPAPAPSARAAKAADQPDTPADIADLSRTLDAAEAAANRAADELFAAASETAGLRIAIDEAALRADAARAALTDRVRDIYMAEKPDPLSRLAQGLRQPSRLKSVAEAGAQSDRAIIDEVEREAKALDSLRRKVAQQEQALAKKARAVEQLQERTLVLLTAAEAAYAQDQVKSAELAERRRVIQAQIEQSRQTSVASQASVTGVTPAVTARGRKAAAAEAPIIAALEAAGANFPPGYRATGKLIQGKASWYGPGFYGKPTATGAPYDAERFTCAMLAVPLGTVVRVTTDDGKAINVLVNDRGPYVGGRVIDMSEAGARMLGFTGVKQVTVEVLEPTG